MSWLEGHASHERAAPEEHDRRSRRVRAGRPRSVQRRPQGHLDPGRRRRLLEAGPAGARRLPARARRPRRPRRCPRRRRPPGRGRRGGPEPGAARGHPRRPAPGQPPDLLAAARGRAPRPGRHRPAPAPGQRQRVLLPVAGRLLQPRRRHGGAAAPSRRPDVPALLRGLRAVLPPLLHLVHREAQHGRLGPLLGRLARRPLPARGLPPLLPHLPGAAPARAAHVARPRALHAGPRRRRGHGHEPRALRRRRAARGPVGHRGGARLGRSRSTSPSSSPSPSRSCSTPTGARAGSPRAGR